MPVKRAFYFIGFYPIPTLGMPVPKIVVATAVDELQVFGIGNQIGAYLKFIQIYLMAVQFIIKTKALAVKAYFINAFGQFYKVAACFFCFWRCVSFIVSREQ